MMKEIALQMNDDMPLRDVVFTTLREAILRGQLQSGDRLREIHLAQQLGVSRTPVREAIRKLELEGLVLTIPRKGAVVANIAQKDLEDVLEVRCALEELAVRKACRKMTAEQLPLLIKAADTFEECIQSEDLEGAAQADVDFHEVIIEAAGNHRLIEILSDIRSRVYRYRLENLKCKSSHPDLIRQHRMLCDALAQRDEEAAVSVIRGHIESQRDIIVQNLKCY